MSKISPNLKTIKLLSFLLPLAVIFFFAYPSPTRGDETKNNPEILERKEFIDKGNSEIRKRADDQIAEIQSHGGIAVLRIATLKPFADWDFYFVEGDSISWEPNAGQDFEPVTVPRGFVTDLTSIPRMFWQVLKPEGRYAYAAVVHDYLYWEQTRTREEVDKILKIAMEEDSKVNPLLAGIIYLMVDTFGQGAWNNNKRLKENGEKRFLKKFPDDFTVSWED